MPAIYDELLDATIRHLENLKAHGGRTVNVSPETLLKLSLAPQKGFQPASPSPTPQPQRTALPLPAPAPVELSLARPVKSEALEAAPKPSIEKAAAFAALRERVLGCVKCAHLASSRKNVV